MPEHNHPAPAASGAARGNIFVGVDEPADACIRRERRRRAREALYFGRRRARVAFADRSATAPVRRSAHGPTVRRTRAPRLHVAPVRAGGLVLLAVALYLASRLVGAPAGHVSQPSQITRATASPGTRGAYLPELLPPARVRSTRVRSLHAIRIKRTPGGSAVRAHGAPAARPHSRPAPTARPSAPAPRPGEVSPSTPTVSRTMPAGSRGGAASSGSGGPRGSSPFGPGYPG